LKCRIIRNTKGTAQLKRYPQRSRRLYDLCVQADKTPLFLEVSMGKLDLIVNCGPQWHDVGSNLYKS
jgi:hypothetical protein